MLKLCIISLIIITCIIRFLYIKKLSNKRFNQYKSKVKETYTKHGKISYIDEGNGEVILSIHGICGGYDQAYDTVSDYINNYRIIAPSRFGYPGSDIPNNANVDMQVETYIELLNQLGINKCYILATSAGGAIAIKFALSHPERTKGLILYCSSYPNISKPTKVMKYAGPPSLFLNDIMMWLISPLFKPIMGMDKNTLKEIIPLKERKKGIVFDSKESNVVMAKNYQEYDLKKLKVPLLSIHSKDDKLANYMVAEVWSNKVKNSTLLLFENGGHLMNGHSDEIYNALCNFIK